VALARDVFELIGGWIGPARLIAGETKTEAVRRAVADRLERLRLERAG